MQVRQSVQSSYRFEESTIKNMLNERELKK